MKGLIVTGFFHLNILFVGWVRANNTESEARVKGSKAALAYSTGGRGMLL